MGNGSYPIIKAAIRPCQLLQAGRSGRQPPGKLTIRVEVKTPCSAAYAFTEILPRPLLRSPAIHSQTPLTGVRQVSQRPLVTFRLRIRYP
jgi:hypothetical protein